MQCSILLNQGGLNDPIQNPLLLIRLEGQGFVPARLPIGMQRERTLVVAKRLSGYIGCPSYYLCHYSSGDAPDPDTELLRISQASSSSLNHRFSTWVTVQPNA